MTQFQYDGTRPGNTLNVTESAGSAIGTSAVRVTIDDTYAVSKTEALLVLDAIYDRISQDTWPPA